MLSINNNQLSSLPNGIFDKLTSLTTFYVSYNQLSSLSNNGALFDKLTKLKYSDFKLQSNSIITYWNI